MSVFAASSAGCARRLPGPDACHDLAVAWVLGPRYIHAPDRMIGPAAQQAILEQTTECLTTPYDREFVQCVTGGAAPRLCLLRFESRHPAAANPAE